MTDVTALAERFIKTCPVGWAIDSGFQNMVRQEDVAGEPCWRIYRAKEGDEPEERWTGGVEDAAEFLLCDMGWSDYEGEVEMQKRLEDYARTGNPATLGGGF